MYNENPYASYKDMPNFSYAIMESLFQNSEAEMIWKLLKYNDADAWKKNNLTLEEKRKLVYNGVGNQNEYSIYLDFMMDDSVEDEKSFLRIYPGMIYPANRTVGICDINFEVFSHSKINHLSNYKTRVDMIIQLLLQVLNGYDIGGLGVLYFDADRGSNNKVQIIGTKPYKGKLLIMSTNIC